MALELRSDGVVTYVTGSSGSGKTTEIKRRVRAKRRVLVWDGKGIDWGARDGFDVLHSPADLKARVLQRGPARLSCRWPVTRANFDTFCRLAWIWGRFLPGVIVVDEIADVTSTAKAPVAWGEIVRKVRAFGTDLYVATQRPQECDKTAQGNAHRFIVGRMSDVEDQRYIARRLLGGLHMLPQVAALRPLEYIERDVNTLTIRRGRVSLARSAPRAPKPTPPAPPRAIAAPAAAPAEIQQPAPPRGLLDW